jgi:hypothetical protein
MRPGSLEPVGEYSDIGRQHASYVDVPSHLPREQGCPDCRHICELAQYLRQCIGVQLEVFEAKQPLYTDKDFSGIGRDDIDPALNLFLRFSYTSGVEQEGLTMALIFKSELEPELELEPNSKLGSGSELEPEPEREPNSRL